MGFNCLKGTETLGGTFYHYWKNGRIKEMEEWKNRRNGWMEECLIHSLHFAYGVSSLLRTKILCPWNSAAKSPVHGMWTLWKTLKFSKQYAFLLCLQIKRFVRINISICYLSLICMFFTDSNLSFPLCLPALWVIKYMFFPDHNSDNTRFALL